MVAESDETKAEVTGLEASLVLDVFHALLDLRARSIDVGLLTACGVLDKDYIPNNRVRSRRRRYETETIHNLFCGPSSICSKTKHWNGARERCTEETEYVFAKEKLRNLPSLI